MSTESPETALPKTVAAHLPHLRRHARALTGGRQRGDALVAALLEALVAEPTLLDAPGRDARTALFAAFHRVCALSDTDADAPPDHPRGGPEATARDRLARLSPPARQALLLSAVEGFGPDEIAHILGVGDAEARLLIDEAMASLKHQTPARVLVIEPDPLAARDLEALIGEAGHRVTHVAETRLGAVAAAEAEPPDLVLADVALADGSSGVEAAQDILRDVDCPVIFLTASPEKLLLGERPEPTFLIAKPFRPEVAQAAVGQALFFRETAQSPEPA